MGELHNGPGCPASGRFVKGKASFFFKGINLVAQKTYGAGERELGAKEEGTKGQRAEINTHQKLKDQSHGVWSL